MLPIANTYLRKKWNVCSSEDSLTTTEFEALAVCDDNTVYGDLKTLGPVLRMSETPCMWLGTAPELGSSKPEWLPR